MDIKVHIDDSMVKELEKELEFMGKHAVTYGYYPDQVHQDSQLPLATVADYNVNGVKNSKGDWHIPPRDYFIYADMFAQEDAPKFFKTINHALMLGGQSKIMTSLKTISEDCADKLREGIDTQEFKPLAPSTVSKKGSDVILINTNQLYNDAKGKVEKVGNSGN